MIWGSLHVKVLRNLFGYLVSFLASFNQLNVADKWLGNLYYEFLVAENSSSIFKRIYAPSYRGLFLEKLQQIERERVAQIEKDRQDKIARENRAAQKLLDEQFAKAKSDAAIKRAMEAAAELERLPNMKMIPS